MTSALSLDPTSDGRPTASFVVDPSRARRWVRGLTAVALLAIVLAGGGVAYARVAPPSDQMETVLGIAAGAAAAVALVCVVALVVIGARRRVGEDAIDLVVTEDAIVGPGGIRLDWFEIAGIQMSDDDSRLRIQLADPRGTSDRAEGRRQTAALRTDDATPYLGVDLARYPATERAELRVLLGDELAPRGQRLGPLA